LVGRGRGEHLSGACRVEHSRPDEAAVHRLVARAAAGDEPHLSLYRGVGPDHERRVVADAEPVAVRGLHAAQRVLEYRVGSVDELLHAAALRTGTTSLTPWNPERRP